MDEDKPPNPARGQLVGGDWVMYKTVLYGILDQAACWMVGVPGFFVSICFNIRNIGKRCLCVSSISF